MTEDAGGRTGFLAPYRALDLSDARGLLAGRMLAQLGCDVLQIEPPEGSDGRRTGPFDADGRSMHWAAYAAGKRSLALDPKDPGDQETLRALVARADFIIESRGADETPRLTPEEIAAINPAAIHMIVSPWGLTGPRAGWAESDLVTWAAAGPLGPTALAGGIPTRISVPQAWHFAASDAVCGAMVALFARHQSGLGQRVETSVQRSCTSATLSGSLAAVVGHPDFSLRPRYTGSKKPLDLSGSGARTARSKWQGKDGLLEIHLAMGPATGRFTNNFMKVLKDKGALSERFHDWDWSTIHERIMADEIDDDDLEACRDEVGAFLLTVSQVEAVELAIAHRLLLAPVTTVQSLETSPHETARGFFRRVTDSEGRTTLLPGPFAMVTAPGGAPAGAFAPDRAAPALNEGGPEAVEEWLGSRPAAATMQGAAE